MKQTLKIRTGYFGFLLRLIRPKVAIFFRKGCVFKIKILSSTFFNNLILGHHLSKREGRKKLSINAGLCHKVRLRIDVILG